VPDAEDKAGLVEQERRLRLRQLAEVDAEDAAVQQRQGRARLSQRRQGSGAVLTTCSRKWVTAGSPSVAGCCLLWKRMKARAHETRRSAVDCASPRALVATRSRSRKGDTLAVAGAGEDGTGLGRGFMVILLVKGEQTFCLRLNRGDACCQAKRESC
jgi:hypothetical protein